jgi:hypothetical protein
MRMIDKYMDCAMKGMWGRLSTCGGLATRLAQMADFQSAAG